MLIEKIKQILGEELSKQVDEKLGDIELAVFNDGTVVPATKHDSLKAEYQKLQETHTSEIGDFNKKLQAAVSASEDAEKFKSMIEELKTEKEKAISDFQKQLEETKLNSALSLELTKANAKNPKAVKALLDTSLLKLDNGKLIGLEEQLKNLQESDGYLFGEIKKVGSEPTKGLGTSSKLEQLVAEYNEAEKNGNAMLMNTINLKIKAEKNGG